MPSKGIALRGLWVRVPPAARTGADVRSSSEFAAVKALVATGLNDCEVARRSGVPRSTVQEWRNRPVPPGTLSRRRHVKPCPRCDGAPVDEAAYAYLLGLYPGDGCLSKYRRDVYRLRVVLDMRYPEIIEECAANMSAVGPRRAGVQLYPAKHYAEVHLGWKHWPCLLPQHEAGRKHLRAIRLASWQQDVVESHPALLLRGLIHSDGCPFDNNVKGEPYPRYQFTNVSDDIRAIFCWACDLYGVRWRQSSWWTISISRRADVAKLDLRDRAEALAAGSATGGCDHLLQHRLHRPALLLGRRPAREGVTGDHLPHVDQAVVCE
jgi:hypothetical protein